MGVLERSRKAEESGGDQEHQEHKADAKRVTDVKTAGKVILPCSVVIIFHCLAESLAPSRPFYIFRTRARRSCWARSGCKVRKQTYYPLSIFFPTSWIPN